MGFIFNVGTIFDKIVNSEEYDDAGSTGEQFTYRILKSNFFSKNVLRNVYIKKSNGKLTEIDLLAVTRRGIYVIESKNYNGYIYGKEEDQNWTQVLNKNVKNKFYNPIQQNNTHINSLKFNLQDYPDIVYFNVVVFGETCTLKTEVPTSHNTYVIKRDMLTKTIDKITDTHKEVISSSQRNEIIGLLSQSSRPEDAIKEQHIQQIQDDLLKCPFCGGELVERKNKKDGNKFWGCKNFPKCRYTKK